MDRDAIALKGGENMWLVPPSGLTLSLSKLGVMMYDVVAEEFEPRVKHLLWSI
jgi:hypothetical protein